ncbi:hypothetical protein WA026_021954 [Henosepilachna vigintioctopunctata]|uniref:Lipoprotein n=1 Tax=Henosepilachna vigintioctopunctata TaxID=420089 RepID=A0AAW1VC28_9CUCU
MIIKKNNLIEMNSSISISCLIVLVSCHFTQQSTSSNETVKLNRYKRALFFPSGGTFKIVIGMVTPVKLSKTRTIAVGWNFQYQYMVPANTTAVASYPPILSRRSREDMDVRMNEIYNSVQNVLLDNYSNLQDCLLRYICEEGYSSFHHDSNGIYGYILRMLLSPDRQQDVDRQYLNAQIAGKYGADCEMLYPRCYACRNAR